MVLRNRLIEKAKNETARLPATHQGNQVVFRYKLVERSEGIIHEFCGKVTQVDGKGATKKLFVSKVLDGIVIDYTFFGRKSAKDKYGLGRTATHEVGHWMNLRHIWGDGNCSRDDYVHYTPSASYPSYGCQDGKVSCGTLDMTSNLMDYRCNRCMNLFTDISLPRRDC